MNSFEGLVWNDFSLILLMISREVIPFSVVVTWIALTPYWRIYALDCITGSMGSNDENAEKLYCVGPSNNDELTAS